MTSSGMISVAPHCVLRKSRLSLRDMRKPRKKPLDALFPKVRQEILAATLGGPERTWTLSELARHLKLRPSSLQRELASLVEAGILRRQKSDRNLCYDPDPSCPIQGELRAMLLKTAGLVDVVSDVLKRHRKKIVLAFVFGSIASGEERSGSDVDLVIVGDIGLSNLASSLKRLEERLGRPVNPRVYSADEFTDRMARGDRFLQSIVKGNILMIQGTRDELATASR
jgi:predicted nucleotidyltransferase